MDDLQVRPESAVDMALPEGFEETELGLLPKDWEIVRLGHLTAIKYGKAKPKESGEIPAVGSGGVYGWTSVALVDFPTLVVGRKGTAGKVWLQEQPCWPSDTTFYLEWNSKEIDHYFLYNWLREKPLSGEHAKTTLPSLSKPDLENYLVPLPSLPEQNAIAYVLRTVQKAIESTEKVIEATRELKRSLMNHLFTYGPVSVDEAEQVPLKETEIGLVPEHWEIERLGDVALKPQYGYTASAAESPVGPKFLRITDIQDGQVNWSTVPFCECSDKDFRKYKLEPGDVLFARIGATTGKSFLLEEVVDAVYASYLIRVTPTEKLDSGYLAQFTKTESYWAQINAHKGGRLKQGVNIPILSNLLLSFPRLSEQQEIARTLGAVDKKIAREEVRKASLNILFKTLLHNLMTAKFRVEDVDLSPLEEMV